MRRRLLIIVIGLITGLMVAFGLPLALIGAEEESQELFISRANDTARFADKAESTLSTGRTQRLTADMARYDELYATPILILNTDGLVISSSREGLTAVIPGVETPLLRALAGQPARRPHVLWPWDDRPYVIAEPIVRDSRVLGAAVTISPTTKSRIRVADRLIGLGLGVAALLVIALVAAVLVVRWVLSPVHNLNRAAHAVGCGRTAVRVADRTGPPELRQLAASFNAMANNVTAAARNQRAFVAQATHQLRTPLTALRIRLENADSYLSDGDPDGRTELRSALEEVDRLNEVIESLLQLARAEAIQTMPLPVDVSAVIRSRVQAWQAAYARSGTGLSIDVPDEITAIYLPGLLGHALDGPLDNALKFARGCSVAISAQRCEDFVEIRVCDSGPGLTADELARAGERFWRSPRHQNVPGTGLGLAITRTLVEECGGSMELSAREPRGFQVLIRLSVSGAPSGTSGPRPRAVPADRF
ncbi:sensor histidine kinase [Streptosporangium subroseum]|uniref:sensor histidine kinase n=1 Tax=Streptosporangium subroseum TaxID=106412 RepID=UPI00308AC86D|nr:HAMP domain-containing histidine kinase [Streptosporangium subroseum]